MATWPYVLLRISRFGLSDFLLPRLIEGSGIWCWLNLLMASFNHKRIIWSGLLTSKVVKSASLFNFVAAFKLMIVCTRQPPYSSVLFWCYSPIKKRVNYWDQISYSLKSFSKRSDDTLSNSGHSLNRNWSYYLFSASSVDMKATEIELIVSMWLVLVGREVASYSVQSLSGIWSHVTGVLCMEQNYSQ